MARLRLYPHRTADPESVRFGDWWIERDGARSPIPDLLPGWDYASEERIGIVVAIDMDRLLASTGHADESELELLLLADCAAAQRRVVARHRMTGHRWDAEVAFDLNLPAGQLAGAVKLSAHLVVSAAGPDRPVGVANKSGSRLISSKSRTVALEGEASRFPTEPVKFSELYLLDAPWTLHTTFEDFEASFMGGVRLLVNTEHPVGQMLLDSTTADQVSGLAMADIIRLLVATAATRKDELVGGDMEEGSVGQVVDDMCHLFLGHRLKSSIQLYETDPIEFDRILHARVRPLTKVFA